jgi:predicted Fe-Mo cluster-binding NifX family protein
MTELNIIDGGKQNTQENINNNTTQKENIRNSGIMDKADYASFNKKEKKPFPKKILFIILTIVIVIILISLLIMNPPQINFNLPTGNTASGENQEEGELTTEEAQDYCVNLESLNINERIGILSNRENNNDSIISLKNETAPFVLIYENKAFVETIENDSNNIEEMILFLKNNNISNLIINAPDENFVSALKVNNINCYKAFGKISYFTGEEEKIIEETIEEERYCVNIESIVLSELEGKIAVAVLEDTNNTIISLRNSRSPFFKIYDSSGEIKILTNNYLDNNYSQEERRELIIEELVEEGVEGIVLASPNDEFSSIIEANELNCYELFGRINEKIE